MLVKIEEIQEPGLELDVPITESVLVEALADSGGYTLEQASRLKASFKKVSHQVHVEGHFSVGVVAPCKRCAKTQVLKVPVAFHLRMVAAPRRRDEDDEQPQVATKKRTRKDDSRLEHEGTFELDEVDVEPFDGKTIDLDPIVREQVLLALPVTVLCRDDCRGLCARCGQDLNETDCGHGEDAQLDPRLAKLKDIKLSN